MSTTTAPFRARRIPALPGGHTTAGEVLLALPDTGISLDGTQPIAENERRAHFAAVAVAAYANLTGPDEPVHTVISDLLSDLRHLLDACADLDPASGPQSLSLDALANTLHYGAEIRGEL